MKTIDSEIRNIIKYTVSSSYASTIILNNDNVKRHIEGLEIVKVIVIKGRIVNIVVK